MNYMIRQNDFNRWKEKVFYSKTINCHRYRGICFAKELAKGKKLFHSK